MNHSTFRILPVLVTTVFLLGSVSALQAQGKGQGKGQPSPAAFTDLDGNGDGMVSPDEFAAHQAQRMAERGGAQGMQKNQGARPTFADIDSNGDGVIAPDEFTAHQGQRMAERAADKNARPGQGNQSGKAGQRGQRMSFADLDLDGDGCISPAEFEQRGRAAGKNP